MHPRTETIQSGKVRNLDVTESLTYQGNPVAPGGGGGSTVKITTNDTAAGTLNSKLAAGSGVTTTIINPGGNEQLSIAVSTLPASAITTGTIDSARLGSGVANNTTFLRGDQTYAVPVYPVASVNTKTGVVILTNTDVNAAPTVHTHSASDIASGVIDTARLGSGTANSSTFLAGDQTYKTLTYPVTSVNTKTGTVTLTNTDVGAAPTVHTHSASDIISGTIDTARLGSGTANSGTFLRGDQTYAAPVTGFTATQNNLIPNDTTNVSRLLTVAGSTNADVVIQPKGTGSFLTQLPDSTATGGNKRGLYSVDLQLLRTNATQVSSGDNAVIGGGSNNTASTSWSAALSGQGNSSSGLGSLVAGGRLNTASQSYTAILGGDGNTANANYACVLGGASNAASGGYAAIGGGQSNTASGDYSMVVGGISNSASGERSRAGGMQATTNNYGQVSQSSGAFATAGDCQYEQYILRRVTTAAGSNQLFLDGTSSTTGKKLSIQNNSTYTFEALVTARRASVLNESAGWKIQGVVDNNNGFLDFVGTPSVTTIGDDSAGAWSVSVNVLSAGDELRIFVNGQAGKTIRWAAWVSLMKVQG